MSPSTYNLLAQEANEPVAIKILDRCIELDIMPASISTFDYSLCYYWFPIKNKNIPMVVESIYLIIEVFNASPIVLKRAPSIETAGFSIDQIDLMFQRLLTWL